MTPEPEHVESAPHDQKPNGQQPGDRMLAGADVGQRLILGGAQRVAALGFSSIVAACAAVVVLHHLGVTAFGRYGAVMALAGIVYGLSDLGLTVSGTRELALLGAHAEQRLLVSQILGLRIAITVSAVAIATGFAAAIGYSSSMVIATAVAGLGVVLQSAQAAIVLPLSVRLRNGPLAVNQVVQQLVVLTGSLLAAALGGGIVMFCAIQVLVGCVLLAMTPILLGRGGVPRPRVSRSHVQGFARTGLPVAVASVIGVLYVRLLVVLMSVMSDHARQTGYFVTATRVEELAAGVPLLVIGTVLPVATVVARSEQSRLVYMTGRLAQFMLLLGIAAALLVWTLAPTILRVAGGHQYAGGVNVLRVQGFALITIFVGAAWQTALLGMGRIRILSVSLAAGLLALATAALLLIPSFDAAGAAWATIAGDAMLCAALYVGLRRASPGEWLPLAASGRVILAAVPAVIAGILVSGPAILRTVLVLGLFAASALLMRTIPTEIVDVALAAGGRTRQRPEAG